MFYGPPSRPPIPQSATLFRPLHSAIEEREMKSILLLQPEGASSPPVCIGGSGEGELFLLIPPFLLCNCDPVPYFCISLVRSVVSTWLSALESFQGEEET